ncbi:phosphate acetyltransferase [Nitrosomonas stercoris]|uniref:Phosphate acetyltransferase n=1 Tax=Nitrosomonas stercoris TaxID=1444684 RepID=A0A4Y1YL49_9PROT|nr:phosphate acetyltransferase [Nitrosomonas stercoris]
MHTFFIIPTGFGVGLTSTSLGLVRALEYGGLKTGFYKPVAQQHPDSHGPEYSTELISRTLGLAPPAPLALAAVEHLLGEGQMDDLMEDIVRRFQQAAEGYDVMVVEGMVPTRYVGYASRINTQLASSLDADIILVSSAEDDALPAIVDRIEIQVQFLGGARNPRLLGVILNKIRSDHPGDFFEQLKSHSALFRQPGFQILGCVPWEDSLNALRMTDVVAQLQAHAINAGESEKRRVQDIILFASAAPNSVALLRPGVLVVTPGDRNDIIMAASLAVLNGVPLAGLLLCSDFPPDPRVLELCKGALAKGLPVYTVATNSYNTASNLQRMNREIPLDDHERAEHITNFVASHIRQDLLVKRCGEPQEQRLAPPAFRYRLVKQAQEANRRIVLPEGCEPRTMQAATICQERGIARCVLLAKPDAVKTVADARGITLPEGLEIIDPEKVRRKYVAAMVELRKHKGINEPMALAQLEDNVVLGTMMLATNEVDGLVSGAINTTANTIRPALQLIKTAPGFKLVSSVFFMLLPEQVVVYGDCAVNPNPTAEELADIALQSAASAQALGIEPRVAMLSYSTGDSGSGQEVEKVREATRLAHLARPDLLIDGPLQYDAAVIASIGQQKAPGSLVAGRATVLIFPDLNTGNTTYKAVQRSANIVSIGPMLQGLRKPVNDLSRGASVEDIVYTIALTAVQAASQR